jgi:S-methylmethionine-dependent homocysteine/selenocysteine methylase
MTGPFSQILKEKHHLLLDGAMGTELQRRGVDTGLPLWSARALKTDPATVRQIHLEYLEAGCDIITANTFRTTRRTFHRARLPDESASLTKKAVTIAQNARVAFPERRVLIAGSMAPLEDCYRPDLAPSRHAMEDEHRELAGRLAAAGVDFILLETMNTLREASIACAAACKTGLEVVVSFLCDPEGNLYSGEPLEDAAGEITRLNPVAFSINCVSVRHLPEAIRRLRQASTLPFGVYANVGLPEQEQGWTFTHDVFEEEYAKHAGQWLSLGAAFIGGCCGTTPAYILKLAEVLRVPDTQNE